MFSELDFEKKRKLFHVSGLILPLSYLFISKSNMVIILLFMLAATMILDTSRHYNSRIRDLTNMFFMQIMRKNEESGTFKLSGVTYMMSGFFLSALLFPKELAIISWLVLIIADPVATLVGIKIGTHRFMGKTLEGSGAFLAAAIFISMLGYFFIGYSTNFLVILISCLITTALELYSKKINIDDNLLIPLGYGFSMIILGFLAGL